MQHLMKCFVEDKYVYSYKVLHGIENISSILPIVLIMDSTYRTNKYRLSTLKFDGVTSVASDWSKPCNNLSGG
jgi:hypothetical protein